MEEKKISTEYITLGQFLKFANIIETGGREKEFLKTNVVLVNSIEENRRGRKLYRGDVVEVNNNSFKIC
ncbi:MAG: S4 domain-containing protein YaaA [Bacilli bacterium]|nr:S4 domain-containing protein YaaA [Bacilli bacterium]MCI7621608.1 S4 domain-containing protein YaaA [Bacilli bacterium]MDD7375642.1 S4 domain-containing protein YaaA [Bacilli bacterium]MDD7549847.1 S4 domain-containing protein YaaA [Bacilli bacterium]MDD7598971.1 S4 domain-containing protein YaaA [Bacilli bacterium]